MDSVKDSLKGSLKETKDSLRGSLNEGLKPERRSPLTGRRPADTLGILHTTLLPSLNLQGSLSLLTYAIARTTNRVEVKDYLWPTGMVLNAWWHAVGRHTLQQPYIPVSQVLRGMTYAQKVLLGAVTVWGMRLAWRIVGRSIKHKKEGRDDDPRYSALKQEPGFWGAPAMSLFGMEAIFQAIISLPFTVPFRQDELSGFLGTGSRETAAYARGFAAGLYTAGLALETLADWQMEKHKKQQLSESGEDSALYTGGVWSIVRHPNYLGDALCHMAFPIWNLGTAMFHPVQLLGPVANYLFLRYVEGDKENEASQQERYYHGNSKKYYQLQQWREEKHSFWPSTREFTNKWFWTVLGAGAVGAVVQAYNDGNLAGAQDVLDELVVVAVP